VRGSQRFPQAAFTLADRTPAQENLTGRTSREYQIFRHYRFVRDSVRTIFRAPRRSLSTLARLVAVPQAAFTLADRTPHRKTDGPHIARVPNFSSLPFRARLPSHQLSSPASFSTPARFAQLYVPFVRCTESERHFLRGSHSISSRTTDLRFPKPL